jgi:hypothetical protein
VSHIQTPSSIQGTKNNTHEKQAPSQRRKTDLETLLDGVQLPDRLQRGAFPPARVPQYSRVERKPRHVNMKPPQSLALLICVPSYNFLILAHRTFKNSPRLARCQHSHQPSAKAPEQQTTSGSRKRSNQTATTAAWEI